ncbi:hypothetical protein [Fuchsiella alkaliacetigena]|uniref:hypothetical protein n=1 Tax=Fuchsiella alkaliacetigena TaxID=957042 RepID=UPI00200B109D|nr:hypothetical protein [Fuchsiella alkaliacetigena]MCK8825976.1 hypothetical protein [Fuchsiella alkaliacetigena]
MKKMNTKQFKDRVHALTGGKYKVLGNYTHSHIPVDIQCTICGHIWSPRPCNFLNNDSRCPECRKNKLSLNQEEFIARVRESTNENYEVIGDYTTYYNKIKLKHKNCGHIWEVSPSNFLSGSRCPNCANGVDKSKINIKNLFEKIGFETEMEVSFNKCVVDHKLPFDLKIYDQRKNFLILELDEQYHFKSRNKIKDTKEDLKDKVKNWFCIENNIPFIRIPYWKYKELKGIIKELNPEIQVDQLRKLIIKELSLYNYWQDHLIQNTSYRNIIMSDNLDQIKVLLEESKKEITNRNKKREDKLKAISELSADNNFFKYEIYKSLAKNTNLKERKCKNLWTYNKKDLEKLQKKKEEETKLNKRYTLHANSKILRQLNIEALLKDSNLSKLIESLLTKYINKEIEPEVKKEINNWVDKDAQNPSNKNKQTMITLPVCLKDDVEKEIKDVFNRARLFSSLVEALARKIILND